jgi:transcriptional regulator with XRE-family HTH domain
MSDDIDVPLGIKIKSIRTNAGLTQAQFAEKLFVSRQAVAKWESGRGTPDIKNLENLAAMFDVSIDSLLKNRPLSMEVIKEPIDFEQYTAVFRRDRVRGWRAHGSHNPYDAVVLAKYPQAERIELLLRRKRLSRVEIVFDWIIGVFFTFGAFETADSLNNRSQTYLVHLPPKTLLVVVSRSFIEAREFPGEFTGGPLRPMAIGDNWYTKGYDL